VVGGREAFSKVLLFAPATSQPGEVALERGHSLEVPGVDRARLMEGMRKFSRAT